MFSSAAVTTLHGAALHWRTAQEDKGASPAPANANNLFL